MQIQLLYFSLLCLAVYAIILVTYRLVFSPIARFPGPKLAAATSWYEFYFQFFKNGRFTWEIARLHVIYGPIVRINPWEIHIADPEFYDKVYVSGSVRPTNNYEFFARGVDFEGSHFLSTGHDLHRQRRKPLEPYFSRAGVFKLEPMIWQLAEKLNDRFKAMAGTRKQVRLDHAMLAFSGDVIGRICCESPMTLLDDPEFSPDWYNLLHGVIKSLPVFFGFPLLISLIRRIPTSILILLYSRGNLFNDWKLMAETHIQEVLMNRASGKLPESGKAHTLFYHLARSDLPESDLAPDRLSKEAQVILGAGTVSTARTLDFICFYILSNVNTRQRLVDELHDEVSRNSTRVLTLKQLERLPYLQALIKEGLRHSYGVSHRMPRVSPTMSLQYKQWIIPPGVPVGMSAYCQHTNPRVFPQPFEFNPDRWLPGNETPLMTRNLVSFSKGSRNCLGMNLAYAELNIMLATLFRPGAPELELFETDETDVTPAHDFMLPLPRLDSKGVRIVITA